VAASRPLGTGLFWDFTGGVRREVSGGGARMPLTCGFAPWCWRQKVLGRVPSYEAALAAVGAALAARNH
jgi:hypothetical protein